LNAADLPVFMGGNVMAFNDFKLGPARQVMAGLGRE
jgi:hypothetical protein